MADKNTLMVAVTTRQNSTNIIPAMQLGVEIPGHRNRNSR